MPLNKANFKHLSPTTTAKRHSLPGMKASPQTKFRNFTTDPSQCANVYLAAFEIKTSTVSPWMGVCVCVAMCVWHTERAWPWVVDPWPDAAEKLNVLIKKEREIGKHLARNRTQERILQSPNPGPRDEPMIRTTAPSAECLLCDQEQLSNPHAYLI